MAELIKLSLVVEALERVSTDSQTYINVKNFEIVSIYNFLTQEEQEKEYNDIEENMGDYIAMPSVYELDGYRRMERFIETLDDENYKSKLYNAIKGKGAFRKFKDLVFYLGIRQDWFDFERKEYIELAKEILMDNKIKYINDL